MKLESFGISNFKAFGASLQRMPLKPITLIFGPNSSGKSSALHSLLWMNHALHHDALDVRHPATGHGRIDLGGFAQTLHRHDRTKRIIAELAVPGNAFPPELLAFFDIDQKVWLELSFGYSPQNPAPPTLLAYTLGIDGSPLLTAIRKSARLSISTLDLEHPALARRSAQIAAPGNTSSNFDPSIYQLIQDRWLPSGLSYEPPESGDDFIDLILPKRLNEIIASTADLAGSSITSLRYVPPLRELPPRYFDLSEADDAWQVLFENSLVLDRINHWLNQRKSNPAQHGDPKPSYAVEVTEFIDRQTLQRELPGALQTEIARFLTHSDSEQEPLSEELEYVLKELREKFFQEDLEAVLRSHPDIRAEVLAAELDWVLNNPEDHAYLSNSDIDFEDLPESEQDRIVDEHLNWEAWINEQDLDDGTYQVVGLFSRWASSQPQILELVNRSTNFESVTTGFLDGLPRDSRDIRREISLRDLNHQTRVSLQDVGVGISQVLPVLLEAYGQREKVIAIEQPEIHIHPALQAELGDVFIESALGENRNTFLLETHSEHLILRLLRRIRETTRGRLDDWPEALKAACPNGIRPNDIAVLYIQPGKDGAVVKELGVNDQGRFVDDWPDGFFEDRLEELI